MSSETSMESREATKLENYIAEEKQISLDINPVIDENEPVVTDMDSQHSNQDVAVENEIEPNVTTPLFSNKNIISEEVMDIAESITAIQNDESEVSMGDGIVLTSQGSTTISQNINFPECSNQNYYDENGMAPPKDHDLTITESNILEEQSSISSSNHASGGSSLGQLCVYLSDSDDSTDEIHSIDMVSDDAFPSSITNSCNYRIINNSKLDDLDSSDNELDSSSSSTSSSSTSVISDDEDGDEDDECNNATNRTTSNTNNNKKSNSSAERTQGDFLLEDLPPIEDLQISVPQQQCQELGKVFSIVGQLVVVQAFKNRESLDMDSVLFLDQGKRPLGHIFEVFGQVMEPFYSVRFNSPEHIREKGIEKGMTVYWAPQSQYTSYIFLSDLLRMKGSDASWKADNEVPDKYQEFSDDEQERKAKKKPRKKNEQKMSECVDPEQPQRKRSSYEQRMNERNLLMSANNAFRPFRRVPASNAANSVNMCFTPREAPPRGYPWRQPAFAPSQLIRPPSFTVPSQQMSYPPPMFSHPTNPFNLPPPMFDIHERLHARIPQFDPRRPPPPPPNHPWATPPPRQHLPPPP